MNVPAAQRQVTNVDLQRDHPGAGFGIDPRADDVLDTMYHK